MPGKTFEGGRTYLSIVGGKIRNKVTEDTPGAVLRKYELPNGTKGEKWELVYESWEGQIKSLRMNETEYGKYLEVEFEDAVLSIHADSRYFGDFVKKLASADLSQAISVRPYDFEDDNKKKVVGVTLMQGETKLTDYFYDFAKKEYKHDFPKAGNTSKKPYDKDDWKAYFLGVKKFLIAYVTLNLAPKLEQGDTPVVETGEPEIVIDKVPF